MSLPAGALFEYPPELGGHLEAGEKIQPIPVLAWAIPRSGFQDMGM